MPTQVRRPAADAGGADGARGGRAAHLPAAHPRGAHALPRRQVLRPHTYTALG